MKLSKYTHIIPIKDDIYALYNSLLIDSVFVNRTELNNLRRELASPIKQPSDLLQYLYKFYFLIDSDEQDVEIYQEALKRISAPSISNTYIIISENCNFNCEYCFLKEAVNKKSTTRFMNNNIIRKTVHFLQKTYEYQKNSNVDGAQIITFYGGEPLLNFVGIKTFIEEVNKLKKNYYWPQVQYSIVTNGSLFNNEIICFLKKNDIAVGISIDGDKFSHNKRISKDGTQTFDEVLAGIKQCSANNLPFTLSVTLTEDVLKRGDEVLDFLVSLSPESLAYNILMPEKGINQSDDYYKQATQFMIHSFEKLKHHGIAEDRIMRKVHAFINKSLYLYDCSAAGGNQLVITPDGKIGICHGYLNTMDYFPTNLLDNAMINPKDNIMYQLWNKRTPLLMHQCQQCECLGICGGGCPYVAEYTNGSIFSLDDRFCIHSKMILQWLLTNAYELSK